MAMTPTTPPVVKIPGPTVDREITTFQITKLEILMDPNNAAATTVRVLFSRGYMADEKFVTVDSREVVLKGTTLAAKIDTETTGRHSLYYEVRQAIWELLQAGGHAPAGSIG